MKTLFILLAILALTSASWAAAVVAGVSTTSTSNITSYQTPSFTPAAGDLLVVFVLASGTVVLADTTLTDSNSMGFTLITTAVRSASADTLFLFVANKLAAGSAMTVTFNCPSDAATGNIIQVARVSGMLRTGIMAVRQTAIESNKSAAGTPAPAFTKAALTGNPTLGMVGNGTNPATMTPPASWTEVDDTGYITPTEGAEYVSRDSGFTGTTITWGGTSASSFGDIIVELDTSRVPCPLTLLGAGCS